MNFKRNYNYLLSDLSSLKGVGIKTTNLLKKKKECVIENNCEENISSSNESTSIESSILEKIK